MKANTKMIRSALALTMVCTLFGCSAANNKQPASQKPQSSVTQSQNSQQSKPSQNQTSQKEEVKAEVSAIEKTGTEKLADTYTLTYKDGSTSTFTVTYDKEGKKITKISGTSDKKGNAHSVEVKNGKWYVDNQDTGIEAKDIRANDTAGNKPSKDKNTSGKTPSKPSDNKKEGGKN